jgi:hypothetical protein
MMNQSQALNSKGYPEPQPGARTHYDYQHQCWVVGGVVAACGHPTGYRISCYACTHAGRAHICQGDCA